MKHTILCDKPVILQNHQLGYYLSIWKTYSISAEGGKIFKILTNSEAAYYRYDFPAYKYSVKRLGVTLENIDDFEVISPDGETYPMFIAVPCGKCVICRDRKKREWSFRATCENVYSTSQPLFVTLTYNNAHLPKHGVFKEELQLFLKRMRIKLDRQKVEHNIRYFAVGEYGSKSGRPHYHLILWNFPTSSFKNITAVLHFIENCWKVQTFINGEPQYNYKGTPITESLGFCLVKPCETGAISYVMKYMRKEAILPEGCNKVFFLSSRKNGGLGAQWARDNKSFYMTHPECITCTVTDPYSGREFTQTMPSYFKRLYFPSNSTIVDKVTRDAFRQFSTAISYRMAIEREMMKLSGQYYTPCVSQEEKNIYKKFWFLKLPLYTGNIKLKFDQTATSERLYEEYLKYDYLAASYVRYLQLVSYDIDYINNKNRLMEIRQKSLEYFFANRQAPNIKEIKYNLINAIKVAQEREIL
ncbi:MAG: replication initiation protein [Microviridae sp.]|nr:MAG: replication initiation protein [Microviridae sp.]